MVSSYSPFWNFLTWKFLCLPFFSKKVSGRPKWTRTTVYSLSLVSLEKSRLRFIYRFWSSLVLLVGPSGLEPPTSCLSGTRSNLLSYEPLWLVSASSHTWSLGNWKLKIIPFSIFNFPLQAFGLPGGDDGIRTHDPLLAGQVLSQLSYTPI